MTFGQTGCLSIARQDCGNATSGGRRDARVMAEPRFVVAAETSTGSCRRRKLWESMVCLSTSSRSSRGACGADFIAIDFGLSRQRHGAASLHWSLRNEAALHFDFLPSHELPGCFHMVGHDRAGAICISVAQGLDQRLLVVVALLPKLKIGW